jgi:hypothetical protein
VTKNAAAFAKIATMMKKLAIADLAERVPQPAALVALKRELDDLRDRRDAAAAELEAIHLATPQGIATSGPLRDAREAAERLLAELNGSITDRRRKFATAQDKHLAKVKSHLAPQVEQQKARVGAAFGAFLAEIGALGAYGQALRKVAGHDTAQDRPAALQVGLAVRHVLSRMIGAELVDAALKLHAPPRRRRAA